MKELKAFNKAVDLFVACLSYYNGGVYIAKWLYEADERQFMRLSLQDCIKGLKEHLLSNIRPLPNSKGRSILFRTVRDAAAEAAGMVQYYPYL